MQDAKGHSRHVELPADFCDWLEKVAELEAMPLDRYIVVKLRGPAEDQIEYRVRVRPVRGLPYIVDCGCSAHQAVKQAEIHSGTHAVAWIERRLIQAWHQAPPSDFDPGTCHVCGVDVAVGTSLCLGCAT